MIIRLPSTLSNALGVEGELRIVQGATPKRSPRAPALRRLLIQLFNNLRREADNLRREACRGRWGRGLSKSVWRPRAPTWALRGAQPHCPLDSASCLLVHNRRFRAEGRTRPQPASRKTQILHHSAKLISVRPPPSTPPKINVTL